MPHFDWRSPESYNRYRNKPRQQVLPGNAYGAISIIGTTIERSLVRGAKTM